MSWVDDCPSGILQDCFVDKKPRKILTERQAAFQSYDNMLSQTEDQEEGFQNYIKTKREIIWLIILLTLIGFFLYRG